MYSKTIAGFLSFALFSGALMATDLPKAPIAEKIPTKMEKHADVRVDNYFWMKEKTSEKVLTHLAAENAYTEAMMKDTKDLQETLFQEMKKKIKEDDQSVPVKRGEYFYYTRIQKGQEYPVHCRRLQSMTAKEEVLLDVNELGKGLDFIRVSAPNFHPDQNLYAYSVDTKGDRVFNIYFKDAKTGKLLDKKIENVTSNYTWAESGKVLFYTKQDPQTLRSDKIYRFDLETGVHTLVFDEKDEKFEVYVYKTPSKKFIVVGIGSTLSSEAHYIDADKPSSPFKVFIPREKKHEYSILDGVDRFYIRTNWKAKNFRIMEVGLGDTAKKKWKDVLSHRDDVLIEDFDVFKNHLVISERKNGLTQINVMKRGHKKKTYIQFLDAAYTAYLGQNPEYDVSAVRYVFESLARPSSTFDYNFETGESTLLKEKEVPGYDSSQYLTERIFIKARDGVKVPVSIVYHKGFKKDSSAPLLIYGYGSYGASMDPDFSANLVSLLDRGFVYALAHIRGGSEMGRAWYENGKFLKKKNTFADFIDVTDALVKKKFADPKKLYAMGGSAGGLLMGAVINLRPELYHGVVAQVPFVDVITTMLDSTIPLTTGEYEEWGNPNDLSYYKYMKSYSPYDNVKALNYPNLLVTTGLNDSQVAYWEPSKWVAKLRELRTDSSKLLLMKIEMEVGHGGKSGRFEYLRNEALEYAFLLKLSGVK
jgi:oligopeptidase B